MLKHVGRVTNTGRRCVIVFREIYDDQGNVTEPDSCLICETDGLPDLVHQDIMRIVESEPAQSTGNLYEVFARERLSSGTTALNYLHGAGRLRKMPTNQVELVPDTNNALRLDKMNRIVEMQNAGASQQEIENSIVDDTDGAPRTSTTAQTAPPPPQADGVLDDSAIARQRLAQAEQFQQEADRLRTEAYDLDPDLKPKRGRPKKTVDA
jgi:hypothetical protein